MGLNAADPRTHATRCREVNHRTKNALQLAVSLLRVQGARAGPETRGALDVAAQRLLRSGSCASARCTNS